MSSYSLIAALLAGLVTPLVRADFIIGGATWQEPNGGDDCATCTTPVTYTYALSSNDANCNGIENCGAGTDSCATGPGPDLSSYSFIQFSPLCGGNTINLYTNGNGGWDGFINNGDGSVIASCTPYSQPDIYCPWPDSEIDANQEYYCSSYICSGQ